MNKDAEIQKALEPVILYRLDAEKGEGKDLAKEFAIRAYPTFVMVNKDGQTIDRWLGYSKNSFPGILADAQADLSTIDEKKARFGSAPDLRSSVSLGRYHSAMGLHKEAVGYYLQAQVLKSEPTQDYSYEIFDNSADGARQGLFTYDEVSRAADAALAASSRQKNVWNTIDIANRMAQAASKNNRPNEVAKYLQAGLDATATGDDPELKQAHSELMVDFSMMVKGDTASAVEYKKATMPKDWMTSASSLNALAWWCFENKVNLEEAERLSQKSVELAKPGKEKAMNLDTLAEIKHARGNTYDAIEFSKKAAKEDPASEFYPKQVERFQKALKEKG